MSTQKYLEHFCIRFDLKNLTNLDEINSMSIKGKAIKLKVENMNDGRWSFIIPHDKAFITESHPTDNFFPQNFILKAIDEDM